MTSSSSEKFSQIILFIVIGILVFLIIAFSYWYSRSTITTDFAVYYNSAKFIFFKGGHFSDLYSGPMASLYPLPEITNDSQYNYSPISVFLFFPFSLLSYWQAKTLFFIISIISYVASISILTKLIGFPQRERLICWIPAMLWMPLWDDLRNFQINTIILLMMVLSLQQANKGHFRISSFFIFLAASLKLYPLLIGIALWNKSRKILMITISLFALSMLMPGSIEWISGIQNRINPLSINMIYRSTYTDVHYAQYILLCLFGGISVIVIFYNQISNEKYIAALFLANLFFATKYYQIHNAVVLILPGLVIMRTIKIPLYALALGCMLSVPMFIEIVFPPSLFRSSILTAALLNLLLWTMPFFETHRTLGQFLRLRESSKPNE